LYLGHVFVSVVLLVSVHACNSVDDIVFMGLIVVHVAWEDLETNILSRGVLSRETTSRATQWVPFPAPLRV